MRDEIPVVDVTPLAGGDSPERRAVDDAIGRAATHSGFMTLIGVPTAARLLGARRDALLRVFDLPDAAKQGLYRQRYRAENPNRYRGMAPLRPEEGIGAENIDIGPDAVDPGGRGDPRDLLCELSPWPAESELPGW